MGVYTSSFNDFLMAEPKSCLTRDMPILRIVPMLEGMEEGVNHHLRLVSTDLRIICE